MLSRFMDLRISSRRLITSVSAVIPRSAPFCTSNCWSIRSRSTSFSCLASSESACGPNFSLYSCAVCSRLRARSARVMMELLMRAMISSMTVLAACAATHASIRATSNTAAFRILLNTRSWRYGYGYSGLASYQLLASINSTCPARPRASAPGFFHEQVHANNLLLLFLHHHEEERLPPDADTPHRHQAVQRCGPGERHAVHGLQRARPAARGRYL